MALAQREPRPVIALATLALVAAAALPPANAVPVEVTAPGPEGPLAGTLIDPDPKAPAVLILPGSGPTDRDGNNRGGVAGGPYRQLAEALAADGIATLRVDKRGLFGSKAALADPYASTTAGYAADTHAWVKMLRQRSGRRCVWVLGHSEGGLVALQAAQAPEGICGLILLSAGGRPIGAVMREQLRANPANAPILDAALGAIDALEAGRRVDMASLPAVIQPLFAEKLQPYLIDLFSHDPAKLIAGVRLPVLILQGDRDIQVSLVDAEALKKAQPKATLTIVPGVNHVLRPVESADRAANIATYGDATLPISPTIAAAIAAFVKRPG
ncbi:alpha/beta hydrolase [Sphingomonas sp. RT2P30]|uniref:alpha/beta hydrolase n=1 Tax=Parasphingomonas halimpatiens TaxID=3096162 RepID=UPI002FC58EE8